MHKIFDNPATAPAPAGPYSQVVRVDTGTGALLFVSGQIALDETGAVAGAGDITAQSHTVMQALQAILAAHGGDFGDVVNIRTFMTDMAHLRDYGAVRAQYLTGPPPSSTTVEVSRLFRPEALLEVEVVAAVA